MPWAMAIEAHRARLGRQKVSSNIYIYIFCVLVGGFVLGFVFLWQTKLLINRCPFFRSMILNFNASCAMKCRTIIVALDSSYNLPSRTLSEVKNSRSYIVFCEASLKWTHICVLSWIAVKKTEITIDTTILHMRNIANWQNYNARLMFFTIPYM